jgi:hypothetical protein
MLPTNTYEYITVEMWKDAAELYPLLLNKFGDKYEYNYDWLSGSTIIYKKFGKSLTQEEIEELFLFAIDIEVLMFEVKTEKVERYI